MSNSILSFREANAIPISEYLSRLGIEPKKIRGNDSWYLSPFRNERDPSFKVNTKLNLWYDHGSGEGGTLIDLGIKFEKVSYQMFIENLTKGNYGTLSISPQVGSNEPAQNKLDILSVYDLQDSKLIEYLKSRSIALDTAIKFCKEVEFKIRERNYLAIGFLNRSGGYELRNHWFKGSSSPKDISLIQNGSSRLSVLEGFIDFLSVHQLNQLSDPESKNLTTDSNFLVLNSLALLNKNISVFTEYGSISLFLDNDLAAKDAKANLQSKGIRYHDASYMYGNHKDVNDYLVSKVKEKQAQYAPRKRSRRMRRNQ